MFGFYFVKKKRLRHVQCNKFTGLRNKHLWGRAIPMFSRNNTLFHTASNVRGCFQNNKDIKRPSLGIASSRGAIIECVNA